MIESFSVLAILLTVGLSVMSLLSLNLIVISLARILTKPRVIANGPLDPADLPLVLVQIPLYNEGELVRRILAAVAALDWPRERLEIQVLDDSTDGSCALSRAAVQDLAWQGRRIELIHRTQRTAYKAGALAAGLTRSAATYVAIFDADFIPPPDFLRRALAPLVSDPRLCLVQARWTHLNAHDSLLTRAQARLLDAHFRVEQEARWRLGLPVPFNGTCGVWRRAAIDDAGGWQGDTLTEDLDLSLRARLRGWHAAYLIDLTVPGALPISAPAWRTQQFRWTKGFVQCAIKLTPAVWRSPLLPTWHKVMVTLQMAQPLAFLIGAVCTLLGLAYLFGAMVAGPVLSAVAVWASLTGLCSTLGLMSLGISHDNTRGATVDLIVAMFLSAGLLISNSRAGIEAIMGHHSEFVRTPKIPHTGPIQGRGWSYGVIEIAAGLSILGFALIQQIWSALYLTLVIGGLLSLGLMLAFEGHDLRRLVRMRS
jgi:cellulose synthase/poly-beta-1,6-N-acetylglucosamine synthase-like glycosyltransferase